MAEASPEHGPTDQGDGEPVHEPTEITFDEYLHPARPRSLRLPAARQAARSTAGRSRRTGPPTARTRPTSTGCCSQSMLADANEISQQFSGQGTMWQNPFANPGPRQAVETASVWFTAYPHLADHPARRVVPGRAGRRGACGRRSPRSASRPSTPARSSARAGSRAGSYTPSVDGHFDRISTQIDPAFGTEDEFRAMCGMANWYGGTIIDDIVPGHTGKGADFRLAEMKYADYPGIYHMVEIDPEDWGTCPTSRRAWTRSTSTPRPRSGSTRPATSSAACSG